MNDNNYDDDVRVNSSKFIKLLPGSNIRKANTRKQLIITHVVP